MKPYLAVQALIQYISDEDRDEFCGSCFRLWAPNYFITARHCISGLSPDNIKILNCLDDNKLLIDCVAIYEHPSADIAIIQSDTAIPKEFQKFKLYKDDYKLGTPIHCFGFLNNWYQNPIKGTSPARIVGGIIQREFIHNDGIYITPSLEFSTPIPIGMSGGPAFFAQKDDIVLGMAIGTIEESIVTHAYTEYEDDRIIEREKISKITQYGVVVRLLKFKEWLESILPESS